MLDPNPEMKRSKAIRKMDLDLSSGLPRHVNRSESELKKPVETLLRWLPQGLKLGQGFADLA